MINNKLKDERVVEQQRKIASGAYQLVSMFLLASILYKQFLLNEPFISYMTEFIAFFGGSLYIVLGNLMKGSDVYSNGTVGTKKHVMGWSLLSSLVTSLTITTVLVIQNHTKHLQSQQKSFSLFIEITIVFLITFAMSLLISWGLNLLSKKRADKIAKQYEEE